MNQIATSIARARATASSFWPIATLGAVVLAGCESTTEPGDVDPCAPAFACQVEGVDVALLSAIPRWTADQPYSAEAGAHLVEPGDTVEIDVLVVQRGTVAGTDSILVYVYFRDFQHFVSAARTIGPLAAGESANVSLKFVVPEGTRWMRQWETSQSAYTVAEGFLGLSGDFLDEDVDPSNHVGPMLGYQPRVPLLEVHEADVGDTIRSHEAYIHYVTVTNHSPFVDFAGGGSLVFCMSYVAHGYCETGLIETHSPTTIGPIAKSDTEFFETTLEFTGESLWYFDSENYVMLNPCLPGDILRCMHFGDFAHDFDTVALTDLAQQCPAASLAPPDTLYAENAYCLGHGAEVAFAFGIGVFEGQAGECYRVTELADDWFVAVRDLDLSLVSRSSAGNCFPLPHDDTYYLIVREQATEDPAGGIFAIERI